MLNADTKTIFWTRLLFRGLRSGAAGLLLFFSAGAWAADVAGEIPSPFLQPIFVQPSFGQPLLAPDSAARRTADQAAYRAWKFSLAPVIASQVLDVVSSYGMRELNPMLAGPDGRFGARGTGIKLGANAAILGIEYLIVRKHPRAARMFSRTNWSVSIVTTGFAAHNFAIR
jgi:hypothetical protein